MNQEQYIISWNDMPTMAVFVIMHDLYAETVFWTHMHSTYAT